MAQRIETPVVTVAAGTLSTAPVDTNLTWLQGIVERIEVIVPPGPSGLVGFAIGHSRQPIIPFSSGQWIIADDEHFDWPIENYPTGAKWFVRAYNTDIYAHSLYLIVHLREFGRTTIPTVDIVPIVPTVEQVVFE